MATEKRFLTTGQAAGYCGVSLKTITRWIERGLLKAHKLPLRGDHRIEKSDFIRFMDENQIPLPDELKE